LRVLWPVAGTSLAEYWRGSASSQLWLRLKKAKALAAATLVRVDTYACSLVIIIDLVLSLLRENEHGLFTNSFARQTYEDAIEVGMIEKDSKREVPSREV